MLRGLPWRLRSPKMRQKVVEISPKADQSARYYGLGSVWSGARAWERRGVSSAVETALQTFAGEMVPLATRRVLHCGSQPTGYGQPRAEEPN